MKKIIKLFSSILICCLPIGLITYFAVPWKKEFLLSAAGSSSLQPLFSEFSDVTTYKNDVTNESFSLDLIVQGGGSGFGIKSAATKSKDIGMASKNPYDTVKKATIQKNEFTKETWEQEYIKTLTVAFDSIAIVYKSPETLKLSPTDGTLLKVYDMFSGNKKYKVSDLIPGSQNDSYFVPYGRTGGANSSGTATSFMYESSFNWKNDYTSQGFSSDDMANIENALKTGIYLNGNVRSTSESNVETWNKLKYENMDNAVTYLSMSFALQNYNDLQRNGFNIAWVNDVNPADYLDEKTHPNGLDIEFAKKYKWFSPFNIMVSLKDLQDQSKEPIKKFIEWIYLSSDATKILKKVKLISLNQNTEYFKTMISKQLTSFTDMKTNFNQVFDLRNSDVSLENENPPKDGVEYYYGIPREAILKENNEQSR